ncbi:MAG: nonstructural protein [Microvirus sp.]|nr:MAG: nonstructural protein [Microvirus sp.]
MYLKAYTILDTKTGIYNSPIFLHSDGAAVRMFLDVASSPGNDVSNHPGDYVLYSIGGYDTSTGMLHPGEFVNLGVAAALLGKISTPAVEAV